MTYTSLTTNSSNHDIATFTLNKHESAAARTGVLEASMGFAVEDREVQLGMSREDAKELHGRLRTFEESFQNKEATSEITLRLNEFGVVRNCLELTLKELGEDEYYYRSGQTYQVAKDALDEFNRILAEIESAGS
jgi:hypothetical protein